MSRPFCLEMMQRATPPRLRYGGTILLLATLYYLGARVGQLLAIPPGNVTAVWPPSGIALVALLLCGSRVWPGVWLGSFTFHAWAFIYVLQVPSLPVPLVTAAAMGMGATSTAIVGTYLVRRYSGFPEPLSRVQDVATFLVLSGPLSCLVSATIGVASLWVGGFLPWAAVPVTWGTWWVGDTIGVLVVGPVTLAWTTNQYQQQWRWRLSVILPPCIIIALSLVFFLHLRAGEADRTRSAFERQASMLARTIEQGVNRHLDHLYTIQSWYASTSEVSREAFRAFVQHRLTTQRGIQALEWIPRVRDVERVVYEEAARLEGYADFQITERSAEGAMVRAAPRPEYFPVYYVEPYHGNEAALGFDLASQADRLEALHQAQDTGEPSATARILLVQETGRQFGFLVFLPIYHNGLPHDTVDTRRQHLYGFVLAVFRLGDMLQAALAGLDHAALDLRLYDETAAAGERLLYVHRSHGPGDMAGTESKDAAEQTPGLRWSTTLEFANRRWQLQFSPTPTFLATQQYWWSWAVLAGGLLFASLSGAFLLVMTSHTAHTEQLVEERTAELAQANQALAAGIVQHQQAQAMLADTVQRLKTLTCLNQLVSSSLRMDEVLKEIARAAATLMEAPIVSFWIVDEATRTVEVQAFSDEALEADFPARKLRFDQGGVGGHAPPVP